MPEVGRGRYLTECTWANVPHLTEQAKEDLLATYPPHMRKARTEGVPSLGSGAIYPVAIEDIVIPAQAVPRHFKRGYAMDVGWQRTAALWGAQDPETGQMWLTAEHYMGEKEAPVHAAAIKARGAWMRGCIDPASNKRNESDGKRLMVAYRAQGLNLVKANNAVESGLFNVLEALSTGQLKVFNTLSNFFAEYRLYRRDEEGKIVKEFDHLMDCMRYLYNTWDSVGMLRPFYRNIGGETRELISDRRAGY